MSKRFLGKLFFTVFGVLQSLSNLSYASRGDIDVAYQGETVDKLVIEFMKENSIPGLSVAIIQAPYITRITGYGVADIKANRLVASNTMFNVGQITHAYTAVAIMQLQEEGKLHLEHMICDYIDGIPSSWQHITVKDLITHSSGLPSYTEAIGFNYNRAYTHDQIIALVKDKPLLFQNGTNVKNSATNYYLLGMIIEKASGLKYEDYITQNQFNRLQLKHTYFASVLKNVKNEVNNNTRPFKHGEFKNNFIYINPTEVATGYTKPHDKILQVKPNHWTTLYSHAGIFSSAEDISLWDIGLAGGILIKDQENRDFLYNSITLKNGKAVPSNASWQFPGHEGLMYIEGNVPGYSSFLSRFTAPDELLCVTILANKDNVADLDILARKIAGAYDNKLAVPSASVGVVTRQSPYSVEETLNRLSSIIGSQGGKVFTRIDHKAEALKINERLEPTQVLLIGNPSKGTALMQGKSSIAIDLPLRASAWSDEKGEVWLSYTNPVMLGKEYGIEEHKELLKQMEIDFSKAVKKAISHY